MKTIQYKTLLEREIEAFRAGKAAALQEVIALMEDAPITVTDRDYLLEKIASLQDKKNI